MNKKLILLPLIGGFLLAGCELQIGSLHIGGKKNSNSNSNSEQQQQPSGDQGGEQQKTSSDVVLDFEESFWKDDSVTPYVENGTTLYTFDYEGITYNDRGCFASVYNETHWLMMKNKWTDGQVAEGEGFAFIGNKTSYGKAIKSIDVKVSKQTGGVDFVVAFGSSAFEDSSTSGAKKYSATASKEATFSASCTDGSQYFSISATKSVGDYRKNGGIAKITIHF